MGGVGKRSGVTGITQQIPPEPPKPSNPPRTTRSSLGASWRKEGSLNNRVGKAAGVSERTRIEAQKLFEQAFGAIVDSDPIFDKALRSMLRKGPGGITMSVVTREPFLLGRYYPTTRNVQIMDRGLSNLQARYRMNRAVDRFHPGDYGPSVAVHELGHALAFKYVRAAKNLTPTVEDQDRLVRRAAKKYAEATGQDPSQLSKDISRYACTNSRETIAEAFADVVLNKDRSTYASKLVYNELVGYVRKYYQ